MERLEFKYLMPSENLDALRQAITPFLDQDRFAQNPQREYTVHSIYFDTLDLDDYYEKEAGLQHRKKIRVRGYNRGGQTDLVFLEIKRKDNMSISKNRATTAFCDLRALFAGGDVDRYVQPPEARGDARRFFYHVYRHALRPIVLITYEREAFFQKFDDSVRITLDKNLRSITYPALEDLYRETGALFSLPGYVILEAKFRRGMPAWFKTILSAFKLEREAVSKYALSLDAHHMPESASRSALFARTDACLNKPVRHRNILPMPMGLNPIPKAMAYPQ